MPQRGRIHARVQDSRTEAELSNIYDILQNLKVSGDTIDQPSVSQAVGKTIKDGQLEVLNRFLNGLTFGRKILVENEIEIGPCLYLNREGTGGSSGVLGDAVLAIANTGSGDSILEENGAKLTSAGVWTDASSVKLKEKFRLVPGKEIVNKIKRLRVQEYEYKRTPGRKHMGPTAEDFYEIFELGDDSTVSAKDVASVALIAVRYLIEKVEALEQKIMKLER